MASTLHPAGAESAPACETNAEAALKEIAHCRTQRWCPCADYLASGVRIPAIEPGYSLDSPEQAVTERKHAPRGLCWDSRRFTKIFIS